MASSTLSPLHSSTGRPEGPAVLSVSQLQESVTDVVQLMRTNLQKALLRDQALDELDKRASVLSESASRFQLQAKELKTVHSVKNNVRGILLLAAPIVLFFLILSCE